jgi:hypothetical protein
MINLCNMDEARALKSNLHTAFETPQGQEAMKFMEQIGRWYPNMMDSTDTNDIIARDATRRMLGTIKTILALSPEQIVTLAKQTEGGE